MKRIASATVWGCASILLIAPLAAWASTALWFRLPAPESAKVAAAGAVALAVVIIVNGYLPGYLYDRGAVITTIPPSEPIELARIDERARAADRSPDFSRLIRAGVPSPIAQVAR